MRKKTVSNRNAHSVLYDLCSQLDVRDVTEEICCKEIEEDYITDQELLATLVGDHENISKTDTEEKDEEINTASLDNPIHVPNDDGSEFLGTCLEIRASHNVTGKKQAEAFYGELNIRMAFESGSPRTFQFGSQA